MNLGPETFEGRVVLVTGTASGIGLATVAMLLDAGARVHAADFRAPLVKERLGAERLNGWLGIVKQECVSHDCRPFRIACRF